MGICATKPNSVDLKSCSCTTFQPNLVPEGVFVGACIVYDRWHGYILHSSFNIARVATGGHFSLHPMYYLYSLCYIATYNNIPYCCYN